MNEKRRGTHLIDPLVARGHTLKTDRGLSLIELLVTISIITVITTILLVRHGQFSGQILLTNLAYEVALSIREAQVYGLGSKESPIGSSNFNVGYGVHFDAANAAYFIFFADLNNNHRYDGVGELLKQYETRYGNRITDFCGISAGGSSQCAAQGSVSYLDITFLRPNPDAFLFTSAGSAYHSASVSVTSPQNFTRSVTVYSTGQISVQ